MKIVVARPHWISVEGVCYKGSLEGLDPTIQQVEFDTDAQEGVVIYTPSTKRPIAVRDLEAEDAAYKQAAQANKDVSKVQPIYRSEMHQKPAEQLKSFDFQPFYDRWLKAKSDEEAFMAELRRKAAIARAFS